MHKKVNIILLFTLGVLLSRYSSVFTPPRPTHLPTDTHRSPLHHPAHPPSPPAIFNLLRSALDVHHSATANLCKEGVTPTLRVDFDFCCRLLVLLSFEAFGSLAPLFANPVLHLMTRHGPHASGRRELSSRDERDMG